MIHHLRGKLVEKNASHLIIECNGIGYEVHVSLNTFSKIKDEENVFVYTQQIIREDAHLIFGFSEKEEREIFNKLISVSGVGANTARLILSSFSPVEIINAIQSEDSKLLSTVKGIGLKTAQRVILDLTGKLTHIELSDESTTILKESSTIQQAVQALEVLGFNKNVAEKAIKKLNLSSNNLAVEELIKQALKHL